MDCAGLIVRLALGRRLPITSGTIDVPGIESTVLVRRGRWGVAYEEAENDHDAYFGIGFSQGQDRAFQLESLLRVVRGTLAALVGVDGLVVDRLSRRIGFRRSSERQVATLAPDIRVSLEAFAAGVTAGATRGLRRRPHEFVLLRSGPTPWTVADVLALAKLQSFALAAN